MLKFDFKTYMSSFLDDKLYDDLLKKKNSILEKFANDSMTGWYQKSVDDTTLSQIKKVSQMIREMADVLLVIGIGGSYMGSYSIAKISDTDELQIKVNVAERFISRIRENQTAIVSFDAYPGVEFKARVFEVSPVLDTTSRTMLAKLKVEPADSRIKAGMYARVKLITDTIEGAVVIQNDAIVYRDGKPYVFTAKSESAESSVNMVSVKEGLSVDNKTEIQEGLKEGDVIIVKG